MMMRVLCLLIFASLTAIHAAPDAITESTCAKCVEMNKANLTYCYDFLEDMSGNERRDLEGLGLLAIVRVQETATYSFEMAKTILYSSSHLTIREHNMLAKCRLRLVGPIRETGAAKIAFSTRDYGTVSAYVNDLNGAAVDCNGIWTAGRPIPTLPTPKDDEKLALSRSVNIVDCIATLEEVKTFLNP